MSIIAQAENELNSFVDQVKAAVDNPIGAAVAGGVGGLIAGTAVGLAIGSSSSRSKKRRTHSGRSRDRRFISKQKWEQAYARKHPKRRKTGKKYRKKRMKRSHSRRGVHYARKTGQPYIILADGRARFIKGKRRK